MPASAGDGPRQPRDGRRVRRAEGASREGRASAAFPEAPPSRQQEGQNYPFSAVLLPSASAASSSENLFRFNNRTPGFAKNSSHGVAPLSGFFCSRIALRWLLGIASRMFILSHQGCDLFIICIAVIISALFYVSVFCLHVCLGTSWIPWNQNLKQVAVFEVSCSSGSWPKMTLNSRFCF